VPAQCLPAQASILNPHHGPSSVGREVGPALP
jgi:hypothetical protein